MRTIRDEDKHDDPGVAFDDARAIDVRAKAAKYDLGDGREHWVPHACVHDDSELYYDDDEHDMNTSAPAKLIVKTWFAEKEGLV